MWYCVWFVAVSVSYTEGYMQTHKPPESDVSGLTPWSRVYHIGTDLNNTTLVVSRSLPVTYHGRMTITWSNCPMVWAEYRRSLYDPDISYYCRDGNSCISHQHTIVSATSGRTNYHQVVIARSCLRMAPELEVVDHGVRISVKNEWYAYLVIRRPEGYSKWKTDTATTALMSIVMYEGTPRKESSHRVYSVTLGCDACTSKTSVQQEPLNLLHQVQYFILNETTETKPLETHAVVAVDSHKGGGQAEELSYKYACLLNGNLVDLKSPRWDVSFAHKLISSREMANNMGLLVITMSVKYIFDPKNDLIKANDRLRCTLRVYFGDKLFTKVTSVPTVFSPISHTQRKQLNQKLLEITLKSKGDARISNTKCMISLNLTTSGISAGAILEELQLSVITCLWLAVGLLSTIGLVVAGQKLYRLLDEHTTRRSDGCLQQLLELHDPHTEHSHCEFDVYVSHADCDTDRNFVNNILKPRLKQRGYSIHDPRLNAPNLTIIQNTGIALDSSRKILVVFSPNYDLWSSQLEFLSTFVGILDGESASDKLITITYRECNVPEMFKYRKNHVNWQDFKTHRTHFFLKLYNHLGLPRNQE